MEAPPWAASSKDDETLASLRGAACPRTAGRSLIAESRFTDYVGWRAPPALSRLSLIAHELIYLDTTPPPGLDLLVEATLLFFTEHFGNARR